MQATKDLDTKAKQDPPKTRLAQSHDTNAQSFVAHPQGVLQPGVFYLAGTALAVPSSVQGPLQAGSA